ncbi:nuclear transport factor 2 family protein [Hymenobacter sp. UV11]|uniref:nuclear transport factor 2 family protein n=1 Tax=Hymenobacter sp. UV11 TaxID=1849735 RepID=UPI00105CDC48|nr:nuclear transport factor 2 family protein [Hymenobacter sp. UV11]TDN35786.1 hypothetical protein A8B98_12090 [Hymenobacter sp. UV11]TFZ67392.1 nuclear transport factor 2 family protein [Hymenobacter sp. UV11]
MKTYLALFGVAALFTLPIEPLAATERPTPTPAVSRALTPDEQLFTSLIEQVGTAIEKHDMTALGKYMASEYVHYSPDNGHASRAEELAYLAKWPTTTVKIVSPVKVNRYSNTAITVATTTFSGIEDGKAFSNTIQMMIAWVLRDGQWQMAVVQSKRMPA